jgi:hypothetical protein
MMEDNECSQKLQVMVDLPISYSDFTDINFVYVIIKWLKLGITKKSVMKLLQLNWLQWDIIVVTNHSWVTCYWTVFYCPNLWNMRSMTFISIMMHFCLVQIRDAWCHSVTVIPLPSVNPLHLMLIDNQSRFFSNSGCHVIADTSLFLQTSLNLNSEQILNRVFGKRGHIKTWRRFYHNSITKVCICTVIPLN